MPFVFVTGNMYTSQGHILDFQATNALVQSGDLPYNHMPDPPSFGFKQFYKEQSNNPPDHEIHKLCTKHLHSADDKRFAVGKRFFDEARMAAFQRSEDKREKVRALEQNNIHEDDVDLVIAKLVEMVAVKITSVRLARTLKAKLKALLEHEMIDLNSVGDLTVLKRRVGESLNFIAATFGVVLKTLSSGCNHIDDELVCEICKKTDHDDFDNQMIICENGHGANNNREAGFHQLCLTPALPHVPVGEWLCPGCVKNGFYVISAIKDRRIGDGGRVEYLVRWQGYLDPKHDRWLPYQKIPSKARALTRQYTHRQAAATAASSNDAPRITCGICEDSSNVEGNALLECIGDHPEAFWCHQKCALLQVASPPPEEWACSNCSEVLVAGRVEARRETSSGRSQ